MAPASVLGARLGTRQKTDSSCLASLARRNDKDFSDSAIGTNLESRRRGEGGRDPSSRKGRGTQDDRTDHGFPGDRFQGDGIIGLMHTDGWNNPAKCERMVSCVWRRKTRPHLPQRGLRGPSHSARDSAIRV